MLSKSDRAMIKQRFGADDRQVERDHAISWILSALSQGVGDNIVFFGGTALARTHLPLGRLSEDIDLIARKSRLDVVRAIDEALNDYLASELGRPRISPSLSLLRNTQAATVTFPSGPQVQIQVLPSDHYPIWPIEHRSLEQRYSDVGPATLLVPTLDAFIAWKTITFIDRRASRDLWDLAALAAHSCFTQAAADLFRTHGQFTGVPMESSLPAAPKEITWRQELSHQTRLDMTAEEARNRVVAAWAGLTNGNGGQ